MIIWGVVSCLIIGERASRNHSAGKLGHQGMPWYQETSESHSVCLSLPLSNFFIIYCAPFSTVLLWDFQLTWSDSQWPAHQGLQDHWRWKGGNRQPWSLPHPGQEPGGDGGMDEEDQGQHFLQPLPRDTAAAETEGQPEGASDAVRFTHMPSPELETRETLCYH